jgi:ribose-phosphate pyrophosphokinase
MRTIVLPAPGHEQLASQLASHLGAQSGVVESRRFPDGERYIRLADNLDGAQVVVAVSMRDPDPQLAGLLFIADAARDMGARRVGLAAPYLAYLRQDRRFRDGEAITSRTFAAVLSRSFDWIGTVDPHLHRYKALGEIYSIAGVVAHAAPDLARWIREHVSSPIVIGPDVESAQWAGEVARGAGCPVAVLSKERHGDRDVEVSVPDADMAGRTPVLVDDIISSARTMAEAARVLRAKGALRPVCIGVHAVFGDGAEEALRSAGVARVVTCNTIVHPTNEIDVLATFAAALGSRLATADP